MDEWKDKKVASNHRGRESAFVTTWVTPENSVLCEIY